MYGIVTQRAGSFSNGPSKVIGDPDTFIMTGDKAKLYGRAWSRLSLRNAAITFGVLMAIRLMTGQRNQSGSWHGSPSARFTIPSLPLSRKVSTKRNKMYE